MSTADEITDAGDSEAASEKQAIEKHVVMAALTAVLPRVSPEEIAERERWASQDPKRGRPRRFGDLSRLHQPLDKHYQEIGGLTGTTAKTGRGRQEACYASWAGKILFKYREEHPEVLEYTGLYRFANLSSRSYVLGKAFPEGDLTPNLHNLKPGTPSKQGILAEFGRLISTYADGEQAAVEWAVELANMRPRLSTKRAIAWIRQRRLRKTNLGTAEGVAGAIAKAIDDYLANHPGTSRQMISRALAGVAWIYDEDDEEDEYEPLQARGRADRPAPDPPADGRVRSSRP